MRSIKTLAIVLSLLATCGFTAAKALAAEYGVFTITNTTSDTINYQVKWGENGEWKSVSVSPGYSRWHAHPLDAFGTAPRPYVRFDYILNDGQVTFKEYFQKFYASSTTDAASGKPYSFRISRDGSLLELFADE